ncbi:SRPBCC family protein [Kribbella qitaiheensis]|uniref:SRPBCC family protein n=1 Tax=Kribbella qitaiheensis TaxID=1544730 RepID=A0A7G6X614_9ACTN|nr:SRPBCC family protein [Kribbella qitaiheensis]QNE21679.1 SRPBCC family protein [Kribbella qitaiheensis]
MPLPLADVTLSPVRVTGNHRHHGRTDTPDFEASITVEAPPDHLYALVSDLPRMGEWSPECTHRPAVLRRPFSLIFGNRNTRNVTGIHHTLNALKSTAESPPPPGTTSPHHQLTTAGSAASTFAAGGRRQAAGGRPPSPL